MRKVDDSRIYCDTVEIVKAALSSSSDSNELLKSTGNNPVGILIEQVYDALVKINEK